MSPTRNELWREITKLRRGRARLESLQDQIETWRKGYNILVDQKRKLQAEALSLQTTAAERAEAITTLKLDKENLEGRVEELKVLAQTHQAQIKRLEEEAYLHEKRVEQMKALSQKLEGENSYFRARAEVTGKSLHELQMENMKLQEENRELKTDRNVEVGCSICNTRSRVHLDSMVCGKCHEMVRKHAHKAVDDEAAMTKHHDQVIDEILDILEPEFYDPTTPAAQSGYDYDAMFRGLAKMKALALADEPTDFAELIAEEIAHGHTDEEILEGIAEDDHVDLVALVRTLMEKKA